MKRITFMKKKRFHGLAILLLTVVMTMTACGSKKEMSYESKADMEQTAEPTTEESLQSDFAGETSDTAASEESVEKETTNNSGTVESNRKLIKRAQLEVETKDVEGLVNSITTKVDRLKGYMESSEVNGNRYYSENSSKYAHMIIRIPSTKLAEFITAVKEMGNVVNSSNSTEDITLQYVDVESHKKVLLIEQERLIEILKDAKKLEDIFKIEQRLSEVRYEIESYESQIRTYDNLVDYSTVTLDISEVKYITPAEAKTVTDRMKLGLSNSMLEIKIGSQNFAVWFITNLPYLLIWAIIITLLIVIIKKRLKILNTFKTNINSKKDEDISEEKSNEEQVDTSKKE